LPDGVAALARTTINAEPAAAIGMIARGVNRTRRPAVPACARL